jgi:hypothetical protein
MVRTRLSIKVKLCNLGFNLIVATSVQNAVATTTATTTSLAPTGSYHLNPRKAKYSNLGLVLKDATADVQNSIAAASAATTCSRVRR